MALTEVLQRPHPRTVAVPKSLAEHHIECARASDYDALLATAVSS